MYCDLDLWPFDPKIDRAYHWLMGSLCMKFHDDKCKGKAVMCQNHFTLPCHFWLSMYCDLDLWTRKSLGHISDSSRVYLWSFVMISAKRGQLCDWTILPNQASTDGRTGWWFQYTPPPNFIAGGINIQNCRLSLSWNVWILLWIS